MTYKKSSHNLGGQKSDIRLHRAVLPLKHGGESPSLILLASGLCQHPWGSIILISASVITWHSLSCVFMTSITSVYVSFQNLKKKKQPYFPLSQFISLDWGFPGDSVRKNPYANAGDTGSIPESGRSPGEINGNSPQYSCRRIPWTEDRATVWGGVTQSWTQASMHVSTHVCPHLPRLDDLVGLFLHTVKPDIWQWALRFSLVPCSVLSYQTDDVKWGRSPTQ